MKSGRDIVILKGCDNWGLAVVGIGLGNPVEMPNHKHPTSTWHTPHAASLYQHPLANAGEYKISGGES